MAGKRNPWGKGPGDGEPGPDSEGSSSTGESSGQVPDDTPEPPSGDAAGKPPAPPPARPEGPRNPWLPGGGSGVAGGGGAERPRRAASIEDIFRNRGPEGPRRFGGPGGPRITIPQLPGGRGMLPLAIGAAVALFVVISMVHQVGPKEQAIVTQLGKYSRTLGPGLNFTLPWPLESATVTDVTSIRAESIPGSANTEKLILTGDQNLVDLSYLIRWNIKDLKQYAFQLAEPDETIREVGEAAMRASVAEHELDRVLSGAGRADIEATVRERMQSILDAYRSGIAVQGVAIEKTDPPEQVVEAFKDVSAAQQDAETDVNRARAYAQQLLARAEGDAAAFDKIYAEYALAPEVTRRRLYYETMESVLADTDKTIIEAPGVTPYLPLPEVQRSNRASPPVPVVPAPAPVAAQPAGAK